MKHNNTIKRVLAGSLALLTVASPMTANVGGALDSVMLLANAEGEQAAPEVRTFNFADTGIASISVGGGTYVADDITHKAIEIREGNEVSIESKTKLHFTYDDEETGPIEFEAFTVEGSAGKYTYKFAYPDLNGDQVLNAVNKMVALQVDDRSTGDGSNFKIYKGTVANYTNAIPNDVVEWGEEVPQGTQVTMVSDKPFDVYASSEANAPAVGVGKWNATVQKYILEAYYPETDYFFADVHDHIAKYKYTKDGVNVLRATDTADNGSVNNEVAAIVQGYYWTKGTAATQTTPAVPAGFNGELAESGTRIYKTEETNGGVVVKFNRAQALLGFGGNASNEQDLTAYMFEIYKDGQLIKTAGGQDLKGEFTKGEDENWQETYEKYDFTKDEDGVVTFFKAVDRGEYTVKVTVWGQNKKEAAYDLSYSFKIVSEDLTEDSFNLFQNQEDKIAKIDGSGDNATPFKIRDITDGVRNIEVDKSIIKTDANGVLYVDPAGIGDTIGITARVKDEDDYEDLYSDLTFGDTQNGYQVVAEQVGTDLDTVYTINVEVYNKNYGGSPTKPVVIPIKWRLVAPEEAKHIYLKGYTAVEDELYIAGKDAVSAESIQDAIEGNFYDEETGELLGRAHLYFTSNYDKSKISYKYMKESEWDSGSVLQNLDALVKGIPTEEGRYKVYLCYDGNLVANDDADGDRGEDEFEFMYVQIDKSKYTIDFAEDAQVITYGDQLDLGSYTVLNFIDEQADVTLDESSIRYHISGYTANGERLNQNSKYPGLLPASDGYYNYTVYITANTSDGEVATSERVQVTVNKKELTPAMVGTLERDYQNGKTVYVWNPYTVDGQIIAQDVFKYTDENGDTRSVKNRVAMAAVGATYSATKVGTYNVELSKRTSQDILVNTTDSVLNVLKYTNISENEYNAVLAWVDGLNAGETTTANLKAIIDAVYNDENATLTIDPADGNDIIAGNATAVQVGSTSLGILGTWYYISNSNAYNSSALTRDYTGSAGYGSNTVQQSNTATLHMDRNGAADMVQTLVTAYVNNLNEAAEEDISTDIVVEGIDDLSAMAANYTVSARKFMTTWSIVNEADGPIWQDYEGADGKRYFGKVFNDGYIHISLKRDNRDKNGKLEKVTQYGVVIDKQGKLAAPVDKDDFVAYYNAAQALVVGSKYTDSGKALTGDDQYKEFYGANIKPINVETGVWVHPYYIDTDGMVHYGEPQYIDLISITQAELDLRIPGLNSAEDGIVTAANYVTDEVTRNFAQGADKDVILNQDPEVLGYDYIDRQENSYIVGQVEETKTDAAGKVTLTGRDYYVAAVKNTIGEYTDKNDPTQSRHKLTPERFGIVWDKTGYVEDPKAFENEQAAVDNAKTKLVADAKNVKTQEASTNNFHGENAYGAKIVPKDVMTGVWVRPYVDFGGGLIVYAEPVFFQSFNDYYIDEYNIHFDPFQGNAISVNNLDNAKPSDKFMFYASGRLNQNYNSGQYYNGVNAALDYQKLGVVADRANSITDFNKLTLAAVDDEKVYGKSETKAKIMADPYNGVYNASLQKVNNKVNVRPFMVVDEYLTVYGPVQTVTFDQATAGIVSWYPQV